MNQHELFRKLMRERLTDFTDQAFRTVNPGALFLPNWHLDAIAHHLEEVMRGRIRRLIITIPPRNAKSHCATVAFPAWMLGRDPAKRIICVSYANALSVRFSNECRTVMRAPWYQKAFPATRLSPSKNTETEFQTTLGGYRMSTSIGGSLTGWGSDIIIIDDPMRPEDAMSDTVRTSTNQWYDMTLLSRLNDKAKGAIILVMQRLHVDDLAGHLLERLGWTHLNLPAIAEAEAFIPIGQGKVHHRRAGDLLHPEREPQSVLDELKESLGSFNFAAQYQQEPVPADGNMYRLDWFQRYASGLGVRSDDSIFQSWDTASKVGELNDYSVCTTWLMRNNAFYLLDVFRDRLNFPDLRRMVVELHDLWRPEGVLVEDKASGTHLIQDLRHAGSVFPIAIEPQGDKVVRAHSQAACIEGGQVFLPEKAPWLGEFEKELLAFPNGRHDDQIDSMSQFLIWARDDACNGPRIRSFDDD